MISSAEYLTEDEWDDLDAVSPPSRRGVRSINQIPIIRGKLTFRIRRDPSTAINDRNCTTCTIYLDNITPLDIKYDDIYLAI